MHKTKLMLAIFLAVSLTATVSYSAEITIDETYTTTYMDFVQKTEQAVTAYSVSEPVMYIVRYTVTGNDEDDTARYKVVVVVRSLGDVMKSIELHKPGTYETIFTNIPDKEDFIIGDNTVKYQVKLLKGGLLDTASQTSQLTVTD